MQKASIPHDALVFVGDGTRAVFLRNHGTIQKPNLAVESVLQQHNPPNSEHGTDRPGRVHARMGPSRSAVEDTDWHQLAQDRFASESCHASPQRHRARAGKLVVSCNHSTLVLGAPDRSARGSAMLRITARRAPGSTGLGRWA